MRSQPDLSFPRTVRSLYTPLALAIGLVLSVPLVAAEPEDDPVQLARNIDTVTVVGQRYLPDYNTRSTRGATKTDTPLLNVPQAVTVITDKLVADQGLTTLSETFRYIPGVGTAQGEGNRDTPVLRGNSTNADFYVDGICDDVPYYRDVYNLERAEALKGANAMIFGRGGSGGVINRITRQADGQSHRSATLQLGSYTRRRGSVDFGTGLGEDAGFRVTSVYENSDSFRDDFTLKRYGINPTFSYQAGADTRLQLGYERFHDRRTADRGIPSFRGRPVHTDPSTFFGDPRTSRTAADVDAFDIVVDHDLRENLNVRNHLRWARYDKFYQNVFPGAVNAVGTMVTLSGYSNDMNRRNLFNQTDLVWKVDGGRLQHTLLAGVELARQESSNFRRTAYFAPGTNVVPVSQPNVRLPAEFRQSATDADNDIVAKTAAFYVQDQIEFSPAWQAIIGLRYDDFRVSLDDNRSGAGFDSDDNMVSPRVGLIYKPLESVSFYATYSKAFQPRAGDQLSSLNVNNASLRPESFRNHEIGAKWDIHKDLQASFAVYRLDRRDVAIVDPNDVTRSLLVDGQYVKGVELGIAGRITDNWQVMGGYAWQDGEISTTQSVSIVKGNRLAQLPRHSASLWNRYDFNQRFGLGFGIVYRDEIFANADNNVVIPSFTRLDAALFWRVNAALQVQLNVENLSDRHYFTSAHSNNNISPGALRSTWLSFNFSY